MSLFGMLLEAEEKIADLEKRLADAEKRLEAWRAIYPYAMWNYREGAGMAIKHLQDLGEIE